MLMSLKNYLPSRKTLLLGGALFLAFACAEELLVGTFSLSQGDGTFANTIKVFVDDATLVGCNPSEIMMILTKFIQSVGIDQLVSGYSTSEPFETDFFRMNNINVKGDDASLTFKDLEITCYQNRTVFS